MCGVSVTSALLLSHSATLTLTPDLLP
uniref:Uncharacterized protein n=1 Tax=Anguilla anguilla TaxID=7936 RepID=A0A0E9QYE6_ANGAN